VIFDWDGTIVDSMAVGLEDFLVLYGKYFDVDTDDARKVYLDNLGSPKEILLQLAAFSNHEISEETISNIMQEMFVSFYEKLKNAPVYEDTLRALSELKDEGYTLCVSSGGHEDYLVS